MFLDDEAESGYMKRKNKRTQQKVKADVNLKVTWSLNILSGLRTNTLAVNRSHTDSVFQDSLWSIIGWTLSYIGREMIPTKSDLKIKEEKSKERIQISGVVHPCIARRQTSHMYSRQVIKHTNNKSFKEEYSESRVASRDYLKCPVFNNKIMSMQRIKKLWPILRGKSSQ